MNPIFMALGSSLAGNVIDLGNVATTFGSGAIASSITGNNIYSQDPAAASYAVAAHQAAGSTNIILLLVIAFVAYKLIS